MVTLGLMASKQAHCCHSHSSCCSLLCPDSVALQDERDQAMTIVAIRPLTLPLPQTLSPQIFLGYGEVGVALRGRSGYNLCASKWLVWTQPPQQSLKIQRARRALQRNNSDGEVVLTPLLVVGHWPPGSGPEVPWWPLPRAMQVVAVLSGTSVLLSQHAPLGSNLMYSCYCYVFGFLRLSITASGVLMFDLQCSYSLRCGFFPN